ncbi:pentatricopeptide repeat-containing protein At5g04780, mitochondrial [Pistacia vera]|uniref:pentatricopeptide repeat-containing protein At5g04780, mitochondrial n=1 Tax=Pistacia vera TaxID=55513 RepID=UPI0012634DD7|nr:pentatricopeptide repeat-containing protein At5g04780, mitochondrial [Pistacia vera]
MKTIYRYKNRLHYSEVNLYHRNLSTLPDPKPLPPIQQDHVWRAPNATTQLSTLHAFFQLCARERALLQGKTCHAKIITVGLNADTLTSNMLINLYAKCGLNDQARKVFDLMPQRCVVSWNTLLGSYTKNGQDQEALALFVSMQREGKTRFSEFTVSSVLCACAAKCDVFECRQLHCFAVKAAMVSNVFVGTALLDVYAKCGLIKDASRVFELMPERSAVTWSSMVAGFVQNELYEEALMLFHRAQVIGLEQNQFTISSVVCACANLAALIEGKQVHAVLCKTGFGSNMFIASSLIDMYAKCGSVAEAYNVFSGIKEKNVVMWNVMISGFARHALSMEAMILFEKLQQVGLCPDEFTYISVLSACSHIGLVEKGKTYFNLMMTQHDVSPNVLHYSCMVDILGRAGLIHEAHDLIKKMSFDATASMWGSLLASCRTIKNLEIAEIAAKRLFEMEPDNAGNHVLLSNVYAATSRWEEVARARKLLKDSEAKKERGKSWIEVKDKVHTFMVGESNHPRIKEIYSKLEKLVEDMKNLGYKPETEHDLHDVEDSRKQELLRHHSEKLALTFGLMCLCPGAPIRIIKNLRICGDCHSFMKFASSITGREIIVRDTNRFHHFRKGSCSCREFW